MWRGRLLWPPRWAVACSTDARLVPSAVSIAVPTSFHRDVGLECLGRVSVLMEKPITVTLAEADELLAEAERHSVVFAWSHRRFNRAVRAAQTSPMSHLP